MGVASIDVKETVDCKLLVFNLFLQILFIEFNFLQLLLKLSNFLLVCFAKFFNLSLMGFLINLNFSLKQLDLSIVRILNLFTFLFTLAKHTFNKQHGLLENAIEHHGSTHLLLSFVAQMSNNVVITCNVVSEVCRTYIVLGSEPVVALPVVFIAALKVIQERSTLSYVAAEVFLEQLFVSKDFLRCRANRLLQAFDDHEVETHLLAGAEMQKRLPFCFLENILYSVMFAHIFHNRVCLALYRIHAVNEPLLPA